MLPFIFAVMLSKLILQMTGVDGCSYFGILNNLHACYLMSLSKLHKIEFKSIHILFTLFTRYKNKHSLHSNHVFPVQNVPLPSLLSEKLHITQTMK